MSDTTKHSFTRAEIDARFAELARHLATTPLPTERGGTRTASADEFMLMHETAYDVARFFRAKADDQWGWVVGFKHRDSRNYVFLIDLSGDGERPFLHIPAQADPFMRGTFDTFAV